MVPARPSWAWGPALNLRVPALALVLLGASIGAEAPGMISVAAEPLAPPPVCRIDLELTPENMARLRAESRTYVPATVRAEGTVFRDVGIHLKGSVGSFRSLDDKPSWTLDFERFGPGRQFRSWSKIHLNNSVEDPTYLKELLGSELFRAAGLPSPQVAHARVALNGRPLGLYVLKEGFTTGFLGRYFARSDGDLYDTDLGHDVDQTMKRHLGSDKEAGQSNLRQLAAAALDADPSRRWERLERVLDLDQFLTFMAMEIMICHWDGYCLGQNNFRIYHDPGSGKIVFLPSGMDQIFSKPDLTWKPDMAGLVARAIMELPQGREQYAVRFTQLFSALFHSTPLTNRLNQLLSSLRPFLTSGEFAAMRAEAAELGARIAQRELELQRQLAEPEPACPVFDRDRAPLAGWKKVNEVAPGRMLERRSPDGKPALWIAADSSASASWRTTVRLSRGRYRFQGRVCTIGVAPLPFGRNHGATLRRAGTNDRSGALTGTSGWSDLAVDFEVSAPEAEIGLVCELRASAGEAWFDRESLSLIRLNSSDP